MRSIEGPMSSIALAVSPYALAPPLELYGIEGCRSVSLCGGLVVDLSPMRGVHVGPRARTARAQGGVTGNGFNRETQRKRGEFGRRAPVV